MWVVLGRAGVFVRCLGRPGLAGSPRDRIGHLPTVGHAVTSVAVLWGRGGCRFLCGFCWLRSSGLNSGGSKDKGCGW